MDILDEIKMDVERERYAYLWQRYGYILAVLIVLIIAGTAGKVWWKSREQARQELFGNQFEQALVEARKNETATAIALFDQLAKEGKGTASMMAQLNKASLLVQQGKNEEAVLLYDAIGAEKTGEPAFRELAQLLSAYLRIEAGKETEKADATLTALTKEGSIWRASALELKALELLKNNEIEQAKAILAQLEKDEGTPAAMKERVAQIKAGL